VSRPALEYQNSRSPQLFFNISTLGEIICKASAKEAKLIQNHDTDLVYSIELMEVTCSKHGRLKLVACQ
jgi:hypothetical protein